MFSDASSVAVCANCVHEHRSVTFVLKTCIEHIGDSALVLTWSLVSATRSGGCFDKAQSGGACGRGHCD